MSDLDRKEMGTTWVKSGLSFYQHRADDSKGSIPVIFHYYLSFFFFFFNFCL